MSTVTKSRWEEWKPSFAEDTQPPKLGWYEEPATVGDALAALERLGLVDHVEPDDPRFDGLRVVGVPYSPDETVDDFVDRTTADADAIMSRIRKAQRPGGVFDQLARRRRCVEADCKKREFASREFIA